MNYDVRFFALVPGNEKEHLRLILNIEAQNKYNPGYSLMKRAIYYGARLISSQYGTEFEGSSYQKIKKVYSIWICTDVPKNRKNTINHYRMTEHYMVGKAVEKPENYDLINIVMLCLGDPESKKANRILRLFSKILLTEGNAI